MTANDGGASTLDQIKSPVTFVAAVAICSIGAIIFVSIFTVLQVSKATYIHSVYVMIDHDAANYARQVEVMWEI